MTADQIRESACNDSEPPAGLTPELQALWHTRAGNWEMAHGIAQDIHTTMGSWIHAHLHVVEGDLRNAGYWYDRAGRPARSPAALDEEWRELVEAALAAD